MAHNDLKQKRDLRFTSLSKRDRALTYGAACFSGLLYCLAFPGFDLWPLGFVAIVPGLWALERTALLSSRQQLFTGFLIGLTANIGGYYWLEGTLKKFSGFPLPLCLLLVLIICAYQGALVAVWGWALLRLVRLGPTLILAAPLTWTLAEYAYPLLFPSYYANILHDQPLLIQTADLGGPLPLSALLIATNAGIYLALKSIKTPKQQPWRSLVGTAGLWLAALIYGNWRIDQVNARVQTAPTLKIGIVQANIDVFAKREDPRDGLLTHLKLSKQLEAESHPDLITWPESAYTFLLPADVQNVKEWVMGSLDTPLLFGGLRQGDFNPSRGRERLYNTAFVTDRQGNLLGSYDKTFLLAFGEYLPFGENFPILYDWSPHSGRFTQGSHLDALPFGGWRLGALICYEDILPGFVRQLVAQSQPDLLVNITNDAWFGDTHEPWIHLALAKFRAVEHHRFLVRSTNSGVSAIIDPVGRVITQSKVMQPDTLTGQVSKLTGTTLYARFGEWFILFSTMLTVAIFIRKKYVSR